MKAKFSTAWKSSVKPRKQRKYNYNAPLHLRGSQLHVHLSKELRQKHGVRALRVRVGDTVKVLRGTHKGKEGKVERIEMRRCRVIIDKVEVKKLQGRRRQVPVACRPTCSSRASANDKRRLPSRKKRRRTKRH